MDQGEGWAPNPCMVTSRSHFRPYSSTKVIYRSSGLKPPHNKDQKALITVCGEDVAEHSHLESIHCTTSTEGNSAKAVTIGIHVLFDLTI